MNSNTATTRRLWVSFPDYDLAAHAVAAFIDHGVRKDEIHLMAQTVPSQYTVASGRDALAHAEQGMTVTTTEDAKIGAEKGLGVGLGVGVLAGLAALAVPGFGLVIGGSALAIAAAGAAGATAAGALAGAVTGYLKDQGADDVVIHHVTDRLAAGEVVVNVNMDPEAMTQSEANALILKYRGNLMAMPLPAPVG
ncbi:MAG: hypothetical protein ACYC96_13910 [Fimbriimonadaceae bacterium]